MDVDVEKVGVGGWEEDFPKKGESGIGVGEEEEWEKVSTQLDFLCHVLLNASSQCHKAKNLTSSTKINGKSIIGSEYDDPIYTNPHK